MEDNFKRSPLFYVGDKYKLLKEIIPLFPKIVDRFIEPFMGGGSIFLNVNAREYICNDIDKHVYLLHKFLIKNANNPNQFFSKINNLIIAYGLSRSFQEDIVPNELKVLYKKTYYAKFNNDAFSKLKTDFNAESKINLYKFYLLLIYGFNRMIRFNKEGKYNLPVGNVDFNKNVVTALNSYFGKVQNEKISLHNLDYKKFLEKVKPTIKDFVYFDPPYLITFSEYNKLWNEEKEKELIAILEELNNNNIKFAVSNVIVYKNRVNEIFSKWAENYNIYHIKSNYISYHDNSIKSFKEVLVTNYENKDV